MTVPIIYFFSYLSPYSYIADQRLAKVLGPYDIELEYRPVLPPPREDGKLLKSRAPGEHEYMMQDVPRVARHLGIPYAWWEGGYPNCLRMTLGFHAVRALGGDWMAYHKAAFASRFKAPVDPNADETLRGLAEFARVDPDAFMQTLESEDVQQAHMRTLMSTREYGLFGVPFFVLPTGETFWGQDRLEYLAAALQEGRV